MDIHPEPEHARVLVQIGRETYEVGNVDDTAYIRDIHAGRGVIASLIREQLFAPGREVVFEHIFHATDVYGHRLGSHGLCDDRPIVVCADGPRTRGREGSM